MTIVHTFGYFLIYLKSKECCFAQVEFIEIDFHNKNCFPNERAFWYVNDKVLSSLFLCFSRSWV